MKFSSSLFSLALLLLPSVLAVPQPLPGHGETGLIDPLGDHFPDRHSKTPCRGTPAECKKLWARGKGSKSKKPKKPKGPKKPKKTKKPKKPKNTKGNTVVDTRLSELKKEVAQLSQQNKITPEQVAELGAIEKRIRATSNLKSKQKILKEYETKLTGFKNGQTPQDENPTDPPIDNPPDDVAVDDGVGNTPEETTSDTTVPEEEVPVEEV